MNEIKTINKANLQLALSQNNEKVKEYVSNNAKEIDLIGNDMYSTEEKIVGKWTNGKHL